jgi:hypothetical protein
MKNFLRGAESMNHVGQSLQMLDSVRLILSTSLCVKDRLQHARQCKAVLRTTLLDYENDPIRTLAKNKPFVQPN